MVLPDQAAPNTGDYSYKADEGYQRCRKCNKVRPINKFNDSGNGRGYRGKRTICKVCDKKETYKWQEENSEQYKRYQRERRRRKYREENYYEIIEHPWPEFVGSLQGRREFAKTNIEQWLWDDTDVIVEDPRDEGLYKATADGLKPIE